MDIASYTGNKRVNQLTVRWTEDSKKRWKRGAEQDVIYGITCPAKWNWKFVYEWFWIHQGLMQWNLNENILIFSDQAFMPLNLEGLCMNNWIVAGWKEFPFTLFNASVLSLHFYTHFVIQYGMHNEDQILHMECIMRIKSSIRRIKCQLMFNLQVVKTRWDKILYIASLQNSS